jgi:hypothetical protein
MQLQKNLEERNKNMVQKVHLEKEQHLNNIKMKQDNDQKLARDSIIDKVEKERHEIEYLQERAK